MSIGQSSFLQKHRDLMAQVAGDHSRKELKDLSDQLEDNYILFEKTVQRKSSAVREKLTEMRQEIDALDQRIQNTVFRNLLIDNPSAVMQMVHFDWLRFSDRLQLSLVSKGIKQALEQSLSTRPITPYITEQALDENAQCLGLGEPFKASVRKHFREQFNRYPNVEGCAIQLIAAAFLSALVETCGRDVSMESQINTWSARAAGSKRLNLLGSALSDYKNCILYCNTQKLVEIYLQGGEFYLALAGIKLGIDQVYPLAHSYHRLLQYNLRVWDLEKVRTIIREANRTALQFKNKGNSQWKLLEMKPLPRRFETFKGSFFRMFDPFSLQSQSQLVKDVFKQLEEDGVESRYLESFFDFLTNYNASASLHLALYLFIYTIDNHSFKESIMVLRCYLMRQNSPEERIAFFEEVQEYLQATSEQKHWPSVVEKLLLNIRDRCERERLRSRFGVPKQSQCQIQ